MKQISDASSIIGLNFPKPNLDISKQLDGLQNIHVNDTQFVGSLVGINSTIPNSDQAKNLTEQALSIPFDMVSNLLNQTYGTYKFDSSVFPVAEKKGSPSAPATPSSTISSPSCSKIIANAKIAFIVALGRPCRPRLRAHGLARDFASGAASERLARVFTNARV